MPKRKTTETKKDSKQPQKTSQELDAILAKLAGKLHVSRRVYFDDDDGEDLWFEPERDGNEPTDK